MAASLGGGGAERQLAEMANYWVARGLRVTIVTWSGRDTGDSYHLDNRTRRLHLNAVPAGGRFATLNAILRGTLLLRKFLMAERPAAVVSFLTQINVLTILAGTGLGLRITVSDRAHPAYDSTVRPLWRALRRVTYAWAGAVVVQTRETAHWIRQNCRRDAVVIPNTLHQLDESSHPRQPLILAVGRLTPQKGFDLLLPAFARVAAAFPEWNLMIIGEGNERAHLLRMRDELSLVHRVQFTGQIPDIEAWLARAGLVVQPSRFEGFPNVVLEAMGMGATVISADCPAGPADLIEDGINGRLVPMENVDTLANVMAELMAQPALRTRLGNEARRVRERFRPEAIMPQWEACLLLQPEDCAPTREHEEPALQRGTEG